MKLPPRARFVLLLVSLLLLLPRDGAAETTPRVRTAGFVVTQGVFNTELTAPWDILQHSVYRDAENYVLCLLISEDGGAVVTAEGLRLEADHSFTDAPALDIVVIPSSEHSMDDDLLNSRYIDYLRAVTADAEYVMSLCDGAFPLAATGTLMGRSATTFPADRDRFQDMFPAIEVRYDVGFVADDRFITSVGGAKSFEPALYLVETLYSAEHARRSAQGLVIDWDLSQVPHLVISRN